jgi:hypothetical protein
MKRTKAGLRTPPALSHGAFHHQVQALTRALDQAAAGEGFGESAIARILLINDVLGRDSGRQPSRADHLQPLGKLPDENRATQAIVPMGNRVQERFPDRNLGKCRQVHAEKVVLVALAVIAQVDLFPERVLPRKKALSKFLAIGSRSCSFGRPVFKYQLRLGQPSCQSRSFAEQDERGIAHLIAFYEQLCIPQGLFVAQFASARGIAFASPALPEQCNG